MSKDFKQALIDSPGVDAPVEHERIADEQLSKCHLILFVVSSKGGFESRENYRKMLDIINLGIPFYIVLNERSDAFPKDPIEREQAQRRHNDELTQIKRKIIKNLIYYSGNQRIDQQYEVIVLNAKRAWTGIEKGHPELETKSGVPELRRRIDGLLNERGKLTWLKSPMAALDLCISDAESQVYSLEGHNDYANERQVLKVKAVGMANTLSDRIHTIVYSRFDSVYAFYCEMAQSGGEMGHARLDRIGEEIAREIQSAYRNGVAPLTQYVREKFPQLKQMADGSFSCEVTGGDFAPGKASGSADGSTEGTDFFGADTIGEPSTGSDLLGTVGAAALGNAVYDTAAGLLSGGAGAAVGVVGETLGAVLGGIPPILPTTVPIPGVGAILGMVISAVRKSSKRRQEEEARWQKMQAKADEENNRILEGIAEQARIRQDARTKANALLDEWAYNLRGSVQAQIDTTYTAIIRALDEDAMRQKEADQKVQQLLQGLNDLRSELAVLRMRAG